MVGLKMPTPVQQLKVWEVHPYGMLPIRAIPDSERVNLLTPKKVTIPAGEQVAISLGIGVTISPGTYS